MLMAKSSKLARFLVLPNSRHRPPKSLESNIVPLRWQEVAVPLVVIVSLLLLKHVPAMAGLPLARAAGVVAFGYAAFLALRLLQVDEGISVDGWSVLRPSLVEYFAFYGASALAIVLMSAVIVIGGSRVVDPTQMIAAFAVSVLLGAGAAGIGLGGLFTKIRWNNAVVEHRTAFGRETKLAWSDVASVLPNWRGITISTHDRRTVTFSQFHAGAAQLSRHAATRARRNAETATKAFATL